METDTESYLRVPSLDSYECRVVDWSYRRLRSVDGLQCLADTQHLLLDGNLLKSVQLPFMPYLMTLSLNENKITNLEHLCDTIQSSCPSLTHLSLIGNPVCPLSLNHVGAEEQYAAYQHYVSRRLPELKFLDSGSVYQHHLPPDAQHPCIIPPIHYQRRNSKLKNILHFIGVVKDQPTGYDNMNSSDGDYGYAGGGTSIREIVRPYLGAHSEGNRFIRNSHL